MQLRRSVVGMLIAGVLTLASASLAQAQQAAENDTSAIETLGGFVATGVSAVTTFAEKGGVAVDVTRNDFRGSGGTRNRLKNLWNARIDGWHGLSERISKTLPYRLAPQLFQASDVLSSVVDPLLVGDGRGAVSGAVDLAATTAVASAGAAGGEVIGGALGGAAGSSVPVVGNVIGRMVGGAIGNFAGGYLAPAAYNFYLKSSVTQAVEAGIAFIVDPDPLMDMIQARQQALYQQLPPEVAEMIATSKSFGGGEAQVLDWQHLVTANPPTVTPPATPGPQDQASQTTGNVLAGVRRFKIADDWIWEISGGIASSRIERRPGIDKQVETSRGAVSVNRIEGTMTRDWDLSGGRCKSVVHEASPFVLVFTAGTVSAEFKAGPVEVVSDTCGRGWAKATEPYRFTAPWQKLE
jgi:hypothetical protein